VDCTNGDSDTLMVQCKLIEGSRVNVVADDNCATGAPMETEHNCIDFFLSEYLKIWKMVTLLGTYMRRSSFHMPAVAVINICNIWTG